MPRPKGSKNRSPLRKAAETGGSSQLKQLEQELYSSEKRIAELVQSLAVQRQALSEKRKEQKKLLAKLTALKNKQYKSEMKAKEEANKSEAQRLLTELLSSGKSADDILELLRNE